MCNSERRRAPSVGEDLFRLVKYLAVHHRASAKSYGIDPEHGDDRRFDFTSKMS